MNGMLCEAGAETLLGRAPGLLVGDGVYETLVAHAGRPFALERHLDRLAEGAARLGLMEPDRVEIRKAVGEVIAANGRNEEAVTRLRITLVRGVEGAVTLVSAGPQKAWPEVSRAVTVPWRRNEHGALAGVKSLSYGENVLALNRAHALGADEAIFCNTAGHLCEGTATNLFLVHEGRLWTPALATGCLPGVTRALVLELAAAEGMLVDEAPLGEEVLGEAAEVFVTSSTRGVHPVAEVNGVALPGCPGPVTLRLRERYRALEAAGGGDDGDVSETGASPHRASCP